MNYKKIKTYAKMNIMIKELLLMRNNDPISLYALKRIEELEEKTQKEK